MRKLLILMLLIPLVGLSQQHFMNGPNEITISPQADSTFTDSEHVFTFNRDVIGWGTTITWDSIASGSGSVKMQVCNTNSTVDTDWIDYYGFTPDTITGQTGSAASEDEYFHFRFGRFVFEDIDTLMALSVTGGEIKINMFIKTQK